MATQTGRTVSKYVEFWFSDGTMRELPVDTINDIGLTYPEENLTAFKDAMQGVLPNTPECVIEITGPYDSSANSSHAVLSAANGKNIPRSLDIKIGIRHTWESGEPQFGITADNGSGFLCTDYKVDPSGTKFSARFVMFPGSDAPAWGIAAETAS